MKAGPVLETCLYVDDLDAAEQFYTAVLGLEVYARREGRHVFFKHGSGMFLVFNPETTRAEHRDFPAKSSHGPTPGDGHICFTMEPVDIEAWREHLAAHSVAIDQETAWPSGGYSLYFRDPANNSVELGTRTIWFAD